MKKTVFTGSGVALVTPIKNNKVDFDKLGELLENLQSQANYNVDVKVKRECLKIVWIRQSATKSSYNEGKSSKTIESISYKKYIRE